MDKIKKTNMNIKKIKDWIELVIYIKIGLFIKPKIELFYFGKWIF